MKTFRRLLPVVFLMLFAVVANAQKVGAPAPTIEIKDIFNKTINLGQLRDWVVVISFGNVDNKDVSIGWLKQIKLAIPERENALFIAVADVRKFRLMKLFAKGVIKQGYEDEVKSVEKTMKEKNITIKSNVRDILLLTTDWSGSLFDTFGFYDSPDKPHLIIIDGEGIIRGNYTEADSPESMITMTQTLFSEMDARKAQAEALKFGKAKKNMLRKMLLPASVLLIYLAVR